MFLKPRWHVPVQNLVKYPPPPWGGIWVRAQRAKIWFCGLAPGNFFVIMASGSLENALFLENLPSKEAKDSDKLGVVIEVVLKLHDIKTDSSINSSKFFQFRK